MVPSPRAGSSIRLVRLKPQGPGSHRSPDAPFPRDRDPDAQYNGNFPPLWAPKFLEEKFAVFTTGRQSLSSLRARKDHDPALPTPSSLKHPTTTDACHIESRSCGGQAASGSRRVCTNRLHFSEYRILLQRFLVVQPETLAFCRTPSRFVTSVTVCS